MKKPKNNLDEMQEQKLLHIEQRSFWLAFWMLVAASCSSCCSAAIPRRFWASASCWRLWGCIWLRPA